MGFAFPVCPSREGASYEGVGPAQISLQEDDAPACAGSRPGPCVLSEGTELSTGGLSRRELS